MKIKKAKSQIQKNSSGKPRSQSSGRNKKISLKALQKLTFSHRGNG